MRRKVSSDLKMAYLSVVNTPLLLPSQQPQTTYQSRAPQTRRWRHLSRPLYSPKETGTYTASSYDKIKQPFF
jgi:hypothetical protein